MMYNEFRIGGSNMIWIIIILVAVLFLLIYVVGTYNSLVGLRNKVEDSWAQIEVLLKRRADLIPNLVETVKGYAKHEENTLKEVVEARNKAMGATTKADEMAAAGEMTQALSRLFALAESYPELKANVNFMDLQTNLKETEDKLSFSRQFYNDTVLTYKDKVQMFPSNIIAGIFGFKPAEFFEATEAERETPQVKF